MKLFWCLLIVVSLACWTGARQVEFARARLNDPQAARQEDPENFITQPETTPAVRCYGLSRQTRTKAIQVPILYNRYTSQSSRIPSHIFSLDGTAIDRLEAQGWEVRIKTMPVPEPIYQRVPVCCPWDVNCHQGQQTATASEPTIPRGPCANGGQPVISNGIQRCQCPPEFSGAWCHIPNLIQRTQSPSVMPAGPIIPYGPSRTHNMGNVPPMLQEMVRRAQLWKQKMLQANGLMTSMATPYNGNPSMYSPLDKMAAPYQRGPMLSLNDHALNSMHSQWGARPSVTARQALKMKIAMMVDWYMKQYEQMMPSPQVQGMNAYNNAAQLPSMMAGSMQNMRGVTNPYSTMHTQQAPNPQMAALINHLRQDPRLSAQYGSNPYSSNMSPYNNNQRALMADMGVNGPKARTPWDLDPFDRHPESKFSGVRPDVQTLKERQLMALAFYKYIQNVQRRARLNGMNGMNGPTGMTPNQLPVNPMLVDRTPQVPIMDSVEEPIPEEPQVLKDAANVQQPPTDFHAIDLGNQQPSSSLNADEVPTLVEDKLSLPVMPMVPANDPTADGAIDDVQPNRGPINGQQLPPTMSGAPPGMPPPPSPEELRKMEECRVILVPKIDECMKKTGHDLTLQQFMKPEYMETARGVCSDSQSVGQCIMVHDGICGQGDDVMITRKMIDSVLQMMGMVCQEILNAGPPNMGQSGMPGSSPTMPQTARPIPPKAIPQPPGGTGSSPGMLQGKTQGENRPSMVSSPPEPKPVYPTSFSDNSKTRKTTSKFDNHVTEDTPTQAASQADNGHHSKEPVLTGTLIFGFPLWIVLAVSGGLVLLLLMTTVLLCLCLRRRRRRQKEADLQTQVTRLPQPLDAKFYTIGVGPPTYPTTVAVKQTEDGLALPPLDVGDYPQTISVSLKEESEEGDDSSIKKPPISDDDADDESDDKEDGSSKKKKDKKDKK